MKGHVPKLREIKDTENDCFVCGKRRKVYNLIQLSRWIEDYEQPLVDICLDCMRKMFESIDYPLMPEWLEEKWIVEQSKQRQREKRSIQRGKI